MKKISYLFLLLISLSLFTGCSNLIKISDKNLVTVGFSITDFENYNDSRNVVKPSDYADADYSFQIHGVFDSDSENTVGTDSDEYLSLEQLNALSYDIEEGVWNFTINAFVVYKGSLTLISNATLTKNISTDSSLLEFTLKPLSGADYNGDFIVHVNFDQTNVKKVTSSVYTSIDDLLSETNASDSKILNSADFGAGNIELCYTKNAGYYYIKFKFYSDNEMTQLITSRIVVAKILPFYTSEGAVTYNDFTKHTVYKISFKDAGDRPFTGSTNELRIEDDEISFSLQNPSSKISSSSNEIAFAGWYKDAECSDDQKIEGNILVNTITENTTYYAKWSYQYVYIDPSNASASDSNTGHSASSPLKTVSAAKDLMGANSEALYVLSTITDSEDITQLAGITTSDYNNAIVKRAETLLDSPLVKVTSGITITSAIKNVTFDGGAVYGTNDSAVSSYSALTNTVSGIAATAPLLSMNGGKIIFGENVIFQNNRNCSDAVAGGAILQEGGTLNLTSNVKIVSNYAAKNGGGICVSGNSAILYITGCEISDNITAAYGGGIYVENSCSATIDKSGSIKPVIKNNRAMNSGGGLYAAGSSATNKPIVSISNAEIIENEAVNKTQTVVYGNQGSGGGLNIQQNSGLIISTSLIKGNKSGASGGGITLGNDSVISISDCEISDNQVLKTSGGLGAGISALKGFLNISGETKISGNKFASIDGTVNTGNGLGMYISVGNVSIKNKFLVDSDNDIYFSFTTNADAKPITIDPSLELTDGYTKIADLSISSYPSAGEKIQVLKLDSVTSDIDKQKYATYFSVKQNPDKPGTNYTINSSGQIVSDEAAGSGSIDIPGKKNVSFAADVTSFYNNVASTVTVKASKTDEGVSTDITDDIEWTINVLSGGTDVTSVINCTIADNKVTFPVNTAPGSYQIYVNGVYENIGYSGTITIQINLKDTSSGDSGDDSGTSEDTIETDKTINPSDSEYSGKSVQKILEACQTEGLTCVTLDLSDKSKTDLATAFSEIGTVRTIDVVIDLRNSSVTELPSGLTYVSNVIAIYLPNTLTKIDERAFAGCSGLKEISIPNSVTSIGQGAFTDCKNLVSVHLPSGIQELPQQVFSGCTALKEVNIPYNCTKVERMAFSNSPNVTSVVFDNPTGWTVSSSSGSDSEISINVTDPSANATMLIDTYINYNFLRK